MNIKHFAILGAVLALAACGSNNDGTTVQKQFGAAMEKQCISSASGANVPADVVREKCACISQKIAAGMTDDEINKIGAALSSGDKVNGEQKLMTAITAAAKDCGVK